jgi:hypothetical protein
MSIVRKNIRQPYEDYNNLQLAQTSSWNAWSLRRKRSTQNLLDDFIGIDPIIQKHMTLSADAGDAFDIILLQHQYPQYMIRTIDRCIANKAFQTEATGNRSSKQRRTPFQDQLSRVAKLRRLNYQPSTKLPSSRTTGSNNGYHHQYTFWRNLNALTGSIHGKTFDLTH